MSMSEGVIVTVAFAIKPELADMFVEALAGMFPVTRTYKGFRNIRLLKSEVEPDQFTLIEEWDKVEDFYAYAQFRNDTGDTANLLAMTVNPPQLGVYALKPLASARA
jgi:heme-degrading monooxygenase HmoA